MNELELVFFRIAQTLYSLVTFTDLYPNNYFSFAGDTYGAILELDPASDLENTQSSLINFQIREATLRGERKKQFIDPATFTCTSHLVFVSEIYLRCC